MHGWPGVAGCAFGAIGAGRAPSTTDRNSPRQERPSPHGRLSRLNNSGTGRIRPLADSKEATNKKKPRPIWDLGAGLLNQDHPASLGERRGRGYHRIRGEPSPDLEFNVCAVPNTQMLVAAAHRQPTSESCRWRPLGTTPRRPQLTPSPELRPFLLGGVLN